MFRSTRAGVLLVMGTISFLPVLISLLRVTDNAIRRRAIDCIIVSTIALLEFVHARLEDDNELRQMQVNFVMMELQNYRCTVLRFDRINSSKEFRQPHPRRALPCTPYWYDMSYVICIQAPFKMEYDHIPRIRNLPYYVFCASFFIAKKHVFRRHHSGPETSDSESMVQYGAAI